MWVTESQVHIPCACISYLIYVPSSAHWHCISNVHCVKRATLALFSPRLRTGIIRFFPGLTTLCIMTARYNPGQNTYTARQTNLITQIPSRTLTAMQSAPPPSSSSWEIIGRACHQCPADSVALFLAYADACAQLMTSPPPKAPDLSQLSGIGVCTSLKRLWVCETAVRDLNNELRG